MSFREKLSLVALRSALPVAAAALPIFCTAAHAAVTREDLNRALEVNKTYRAAAGMLPGAPHWVAKSDVVWLDVTDGTGHEYVLYDAAADRRQTLDEGRVAAAMGPDGAALATSPHAALRELGFDDGATGFHFRTEHAQWHCTLPGYVCEKKNSPGDPQPDDDATGPHFEGNDPHRRVASPDGAWEAFIEDFNVFAQKKAAGSAPVRLSDDGNAGDYYQFSDLAWSPDSRRLLAVRTRQGMRRQVHYVQSSPEDQLQPKSSSLFYAKPGDVLDLQQPVLFTPATGAEQAISNADFPNPYELSHFAWRADSSAFTFVYNQRGHQRLDLLSVDAATGAVRRVIDETSPTFLEYTDLDPNPQGTGKFYLHEVDGGRQLLWLSERDGWAHLYLYDESTGRVKNQVTRGKWVVRGVEYIDEARKEIYFDASGVDPALDPYFTQLYRIGFDGTGMTRISSDTAADHQVSFSEDGQYYTDLWSRVDLAPTLAVRRTQDNRELATLAQGDLTKLRAAGWTPPEVFVAKGRDGVTDIWGVIYKPANFDPSRHYPVVEDIYAGPQGSFVPKSFSSWTQPLTQLGFVVVQMDGMGTNNRSKAFHDVAWKNLKDAGFPDRILWHKAAAARFPWYDITRVGLFGTSAGGQSALGGLLFHPEFYKAAVSNSGCHDNRMDKLWWNEQWMGWPIGPQYAESSNVINAWRLQGRLLLVMGEMDTNVDPSSTLQVANALIHADKDFELLDVPNGGHGAGGLYGERRLMEFFLSALTDVVVPSWNDQPAAGQ